MQMKFLTIIISFIIFISISPKSFALTSNVILAPSTTPTAKISPKVTEKPTSSDLINNLKERIASRVAELKLVEKRGIIGIVTDVSDTQITLSDLQNNTRFVDVDEITKFSSPSSKGSFGISDIKKGEKLGILGLYNKQSRRILGRFVNVVTLPKAINGVVAAIDNINFSLTFVTEDQGNLNVEIEKITKTSTYTKDAGVTKSGFTKIKEGMRAYVFGFPDIKDKKTIIASRIIIFPDIPKNPKITIEESALTPDETIVPSTGSGKKLTPIVK